MFTNPRNLRRLFWSTVAVLAALLILPSTGWLLRAQWRSLLNPVPGVQDNLRNVGMKQLAIEPGPRSDLPARLNREAARHPNDYEMQVSAAITVAPDGSPPTALTRMARLGSLIARYPRRPELYAHLIRCMTEGPVRVNRDEEYLLIDGHLPQFHRPGASRPGDVCTFEKAATIGERLDPNNAYFPMMEAAGLFAVHQDREALDAIRRASEKPFFDDYVPDEAIADLRLARATEGRLSALQMEAAYGQVWLPHLSALRAAATVAVYLAMKAEKSGHPADGIAIRHAVMRCGGLIRADSTSFIGSLVGVAISRLGATRPGGAPSLRVGDWSSSEKCSIAEERAYLSYLNRLGARNEARWAKNELDNSSRVRNLAESAFVIEPLGGDPMLRLIAWWILDLTVLPSGLCFLFLAGIAGLRWRRRYGITPLLTAVVFISALAAGAWFRPWTGAFGNVVHFISLADPRIGGWLSVPAGMMLAVMSDPFGVRPFCVVAVVGLPILLLLLVAATALIRRKPLTGSLVCWMRRSGAAVGCILLLSYGALLIGTLQVERATSADLNQRVQGEGRHFARRGGVTWPAAPPPE
ncbi:MAG TPA: hypothetical protein VFJ58_23495 [Armatimonadota bacterium]|nr:hypothetical protein [Armatimonadota bacterium]